MIKLNPTSWKIMLEVLVKTNPTAVREVPIEFVSREAGESKFTLKEASLYLKHLAILVFHKHQKALSKMVRFGLVGLIGAAVHFGILYFLTDVTGLWYLLSAVVAILAASTSNYILNNKFTFLDGRIKNKAIGWGKYVTMSFTCDGIYLGLLAFFVEIVGLWYMLGALISILILFPVKYKVASKLIWKEGRKNGDDADYDWYNFFRGGPLQKKWKQAIANTVWNWIPQSENLLNIGCGSSPIATHYPKSVNVDTNIEKLAFLQRKMPNIIVSCSSAEKLPFIDEQFDHAICIEMIEHTLKTEQTISEIARVLKVGSKVIIATPDYGKTTWNILKFFVGREDDHVSHFTRESLEKLCSKHGLSPVRHKYIATCDLCEMFVKI